MDNNIKNALKNALKISIIVVYCIILLKLVMAEQLMVIEILGYICAGLIPVYIVVTYLSYRNIERVNKTTKTNIKILLNEYDKFIEENCKK